MFILLHLDYLQQEDSTFHLFTEVCHIQCHCKALNLMHDANPNMGLSFLSVTTHGCPKGDLKLMTKSH